MKKLLAIILSFSLLIGACVFSASASEGKITQALSDAVTNDSNDTLSVYISLKETVFESQIEQIVSENYTWTNEQEHLKYYRQELKKAVTARKDAFLEENGGLIEKIIVNPLFTEFIIAEVKKENIFALAALDDVDNLSLIENAIPVTEDEPPTEEPAVESENLYLDSFKEKYVDDEYWEDAELLCYEELYYCKDNNGDVEWAFIHAQTNILLTEPVDRVFYGVHVHQANIYVPFEYGYGVYDVKEDRFYDITEVCYYNETHTTPKYRSAVSYFREYYKPEKTYNQYEDEFIAWSVNKFGEECLSEGCEYDELYTHFDDGEPDWVLVSAEYLLEEPEPILWLRIGGVGGRTIFSGSIQSPFPFGYGVYNVKENEFYGLECFDDNPDKLLFVTPEQSLDYSEYDGLIEALTSLDIGYLTGDVNRDGTVDILDAAAIQKYSVGKITLDENEREFSDVNNDYRVDILDAVAIQKAAVQ